MDQPVNLLIFKAIEAEQLNNRELKAESKSDFPYLCISFLGQTMYLFPAGEREIQATLEAVEQVSSLWGAL